MAPVLSRVGSDFGFGKRTAASGNTIVYSSLGSISRSGYVVNGPEQLYRNRGITDGGSYVGFNPWGAISGTQTQSGLSISFSSTIKVYYNVNVGGGTISVNGNSKSATVPSGGNTTIGLLNWTGLVSSPFSSISFSSPNDGIGVYVYGIELDGELLIDAGY